MSSGQSRGLRLFRVNGQYRVRRDFDLLGQFVSRGLEGGEGWYVATDKATSSRESTRIATLGPNFYFLLLSPKFHLPPFHLALSLSFPNAPYSILPSCMDPLFSPPPLLPVYSVPF
jgi:hypothetical protein